MKTRKLGYSDLELTEVGFGAWAIGGEWKFGWGPQDDKEAITGIQRAVELGVNWIDTAAIYGLGHSEELVGKAVESFRDDVIIATKCSIVFDDKGNTSNSLKRETIIRECEDSLRRLNMDWIDLYQIHWPMDEERIEEGWEAIAGLIAKGKIKYGGVSNFNLSHLERAQGISPIASLQPPYSMMRREVEGEIFDYCEEKQIGVVAYSPMQCGLLTGSFDMDRVAESDWRRQAEEFKEPNLSVNLTFADELKPIAQKYGKSVAQLAIAWVLRLDVVTSAIVGSRRPSQIEETIGGAGWKIEDDDLETIEKLTEERIKKVEAIGGFVKR